MQSEQLYVLINSAEKIQAQYSASNIDNTECELLNRVSHDIEILNHFGISDIEKIYDMYTIYHVVHSPYSNRIIKTYKYNLTHSKLECIDNLASNCIGNLHCPENIISLNVKPLTADIDNHDSVIAEADKLLSKIHTSDDVKLFDVVCKKKSNSDSNSKLTRRVSNIVDNLTTVDKVRQIEQHNTKIPCEQSDDEKLDDVCIDDIDYCDDEGVGDACENGSTLIFDPNSDGCTSDRVGHTSLKDSEDPADSDDCDDLPEVSTDDDDDPPELKDLKTKMREIKNAVIEKKKKLHNADKSHDVARNEIAEQICNIKTLETHQRIQKEKDDRLKIQFEEDKKTFTKISDDIDKNIITEKDISPLFCEKYKFFKSIIDLKDQISFDDPSIFELYVDECVDPIKIKSIHDDLFD